MSSRTFAKFSETTKIIADVTNDVRRDDMLSTMIAKGERYTEELLVSYPWEVPLGNERTAREIDEEVEHEREKQVVRKGRD